MADRQILNTAATPDPNIFETEDFTKYVNRLKKAMETEILHMECEQTLLAKRFERNLKRSAKIAKKHEETIKTFVSTRRKIELELYQKALKNAFAGVSTPKQKTEMSTNSGDVKSPSEKLKEFHRTFQVPYKKEFSVKSNDLSASASSLDIRCVLWRKVSDCIERKSRVQSAPPWALASKPPLNIQRSHTNALKMLGINRFLVQPLSGQLQIDKIKLQKRRSKENKVESEVIRDFVETLAPLKIQPGPSQTIIDANELYGKTATLTERNPKVHSVE